MTCLGGNLSGDDLVEGLGSIVDAGSSVTLNCCESATGDDNISRHLHEETEATVVGYVGQSGDNRTREYR